MGKKIHEYTGERISVSYDVKRCIHAEECVHGLPGVFDPKKRPWVDPDGADTEEVARVVERCPTGALRFRRLDGGPAEPVPEVDAVMVTANGPLYVSGDFEIVAGGEPDGLRETRAALCRCGESANKPFCDNAHLECGFSDPGSVDEARGTAAEEDGAGGAERNRVAIRPSPNGPLLFEGDVQLRGADGTNRVVVANPALCRCGHSHDKPFCDGSHFSAGFQAD